MSLAEPDPRRSTTPCDNCGGSLAADLTHDARSQDASWWSEPYNALWITFTGGVGQFVDYAAPLDTPMIVLCHECAHDLCNIFPGIKTAIDPLNSHSHTAKYREENPSHQGRDCDQDRPI